MPSPKHAYWEGSPAVVGGALLSSNCALDCGSKPSFRVRAWLCNKLFLYAAQAFARPYEREAVILRTLHWE